MTDIDDATFWLQLGDGFGRSTAAALRLLRYGSADARAWHSLRGGLKLMYEAIGKRYSEASTTQTQTPVVPIGGIDMPVRGQ